MPLHWFQYADDAAVISGQEQENQILLNRFSTADSSYSHFKYFQEKCDCKGSLTLSGVTQISWVDD